jgi:hypothetical protein
VPPAGLQLALARWAAGYHLLAAAVGAEIDQTASGKRPSALAAVDQSGRMDPRRGLGPERVRGGQVG